MSKHMHIDCRGNRITGCDRDDLEVSINKVSPLPTPPPKKKKGAHKIDPTIFGYPPLTLIDSLELAGISKVGQGRVVIG